VSLRRWAARGLDVLAVVVVLAAVAKFLILPHLANRQIVQAPPVKLATLAGGRFDLESSHGRLVFLDFWASWCGPCRVMAPQFERAAAILEPDLRLVKVNIDEEPALAQRFRVSGIPALLLAFKGRELARTAGARSAAQLVEWARSQLAEAKLSPADARQR